MRNRYVLVLAALALAPAAVAQKSALTAEQIMEKSIAAQGGREAMAKFQSCYIKGTLAITAMGVNAGIEISQKAPDKRLILVKVEGFGDVRNGFDGQTAWADDPQQGMRTLTGEALDRVRRDSAFLPELKWKEFYTKMEALPNQKVGGRDAYVLRLTPKWGKPITDYYDAETFLSLRRDLDGDDGSTVESYMSDYRDVQGVKVPGTIRQVTGNGEVMLKLIEVKYNVPMDDAQFVKPK